MPSDAVAKTASNVSLESRADSPRPRPKTHVVLAVNASPFSRYAVEWAIAHYLRADAAQRVTVLTALQPPIQMGYYYSTDAVQYMEKVNDEAKAAAQTTVRDYVSAIHDAAGKGLEVKAVVIAGEERDAIVDFVNDEAKKAAAAGEDMVVVMGSRDMPKLKRAFVGSVSDYCVHHCHTSVIVVKRPSA